MFWISWNHPTPAKSQHFSSKWQKHLQKSESQQKQAEWDLKQLCGSSQTSPHSRWTECFLMELSTHCWQRPEPAVRSITVRRDQMVLIQGGRWVNETVLLLPEEGKNTVYPKINFIFNIFNQWHPSTSSSPVCWRSSGSLHQMQMKSVERMCFRIVWRRGQMVFFRELACTQRWQLPKLFLKLTAYQMSLSHFICVKETLKILEVFIGARCIEEN